MGRQRSIIVILTLEFFFGSSAQALQCNGSEALCHLRYNEVTYPTSHNATSNQKTWLLELLPKSNINDQSIPLQEQFELGIRALKVPIHSGGNSLTVCHGMGERARGIVKRRLCGRLWLASHSCESYVDQLDSCFIDPAAISLTQLFREIGTFLKSHPEEVLTVFLEDSADHLDWVSHAVEESEIAHHLHVQSPKEEWPTLEEMIQKGHRLVIFLDRALDHAGHHLSQYPYFNFTPDFVKSSRYHFKTVFDLQKNQPSAEDHDWAHQISLPSHVHNQLFVLQHFVTPALAGNGLNASEVNEASFLKSRLTRYQSQLNVTPNFIWVDFVELPINRPGMIDVVREINQAAASSHKDLHHLAYPVHR